MVDLTAAAARKSSASAVTALTNSHALRASSAASRASAHVTELAFACEVPLVVQALEKHFASAAFVGGHNTSMLVHLQVSLCESISSLALHSSVTGLVCCSVPHLRPGANEHVVCPSTDMVFAVAAFAVTHYIPWREKSLENSLNVFRRQDIKLSV